MMRAILADTGPLYAAVDPHDARHEQSLNELARLAREKYQVVLAYPTLLEAYTIVMHRLGKDVASTWLSELAEAATINPTVEDYREAFTRVRTLGDQDITLFDATLAALSVRMGVAVWTYDHHFDVMRVSVWR